MSDASFSLTSRTWIWLRRISQIAFFLLFVWLFLYAGGVSSCFETNRPLLERGLDLLSLLKEDAEKLAAGDLNQLMRCWENIHRMWIAESHMRHLMFREETRWPGYYYRSDFPQMDEKNWHCFVNSVWNPKTGEWTVKKVPIKNLPV